MKRDHLIHPIPLTKSSPTGGGNGYENRAPSLKRRAILSLQTLLPG